MPRGSVFFYRCEILAVKFYRRFFTAVKFLPDFVKNLLQNTENTKKTANYKDRIVKIFACGALMLFFMMNLTYKCGKSRPLGREIFLGVKILPL